MNNVPVFCLYSRYHKITYYKKNYNYYYIIVLLHICFCAKDKLQRNDTKLEQRIYIGNELRYCSVCYAF